MTWRLQIARRAQRELQRLPAKDRQRIAAALIEMRENPFSGDIARLRAERTSWRRRVGSYRIFFDVHPEPLVVDVVEIARRTSTTY